MLRLLSLLLPALIPSWRFFKTVEPSPRVQWAVDGGPWQDYRPRPVRLGVGQSILQLFWNPGWNETLFMVSLAERLTIDPHDAASLAAIWRRLGRDADRAGIGPDQYMRFRLVFASRAADQITYVADPRRVSVITA